LVEEVIGHVIRILNKYKLVIDVGKEDGIKEEDEFVVYTEGEEILGLGGENLGKLELIKGNIEVIQVQNNYSICSSYEIEEINGLPMNLLADYGTKRVKKAVPLNVDEEDFEDTVTSISEKIKKGDLIKKID
jgi:hypothetical protein